MTLRDLVTALAERAAAVRATGNFGPVVLLDQDEALIRLVACWPNVPVSQLPDLDTKVPEELPESSRLRWLWALLEPDPIPSWLRIAGLPDAAYTRRLCWVAIDNRMVNLDGTVSQWVDQYLSRTVARRLGGGGGGR